MATDGKSRSKRARTASRSRKKPPTRRTVPAKVSRAITVKNEPKPLRLYVEEPPAAAPSPFDELPGWPSLCRSFEQSTGWSLRLTNLEEIDVGVPGSVKAEVIPLATTEIRGKGKRTTRITQEQAQPLAADIASVVTEWQRTRHALWLREAELAAGVPVVAQPNEQQHLAVRLETILRTGAEAIGCQAAAAYLLDETTSQLKLRSAWGLPRHRLLEPGRELRGAIADLEALLGQAVTLEDTSLLPHWRAPENYPSAACVPLSTPAMPIGTLWVFCNRRRDFTPEQTNLLEIVAGRVAAELERAMLLQEVTQARRTSRDGDRGLAWQRSRLPQVEPLLDHWQVAGWSSWNERISGAFHDWCVLPNGRLSLAVGAATGGGPEGTLTAAALHSALRAHLHSAKETRELMRNVNDTFWTSCCGDQFGSLANLQITPETGAWQASATGTSGAVILKKNGPKFVADREVQLGADPDASFSQQSGKLAKGERLVLYHASEPTSRGKWKPEALGKEIEQAVRSCRRATLQQITDTVVAVLKNRTGEHGEGAVVVARRA